MIAEIGFDLRRVGDERDGDIDRLPLRFNRDLGARHGESKHDDDRAHGDDRNDRA